MIALLILFVVLYASIPACLVWTAQGYMDAAATSERRGQSPVRVVPGGGTFSEQAR